DAETVDSLLIEARHAGKKPADVQRFSQGDSIVLEDDLRRMKEDIRFPGRHRDGLARELRFQLGSLRYERHVLHHPRIQERDIALVTPGNRIVDMSWHQPLIARRKLDLRTLDEALLEPHRPGRHSPSISREDLAYPRPVSILNEDVDVAIGIRIVSSRLQNDMEYPGIGEQGRYSGHRAPVPFERRMNRTGLDIEGESGRVRQVIRGEFTIRPPLRREGPNCVYDRPVDTTH